MRSSIAVASPPAKGLMIYDGDCNFCSLWIHRWQLATGDRLDFLPFQDPEVAARYPEVPRGQFETAVQLVETSGTVYGGAEAVFRALAHNPHETWLLDWYEHSLVFAHASEWGYRLVARHRGFFSALTRLAWGRHLEPPTRNLVRWVFMRSLGLIYLIAFVSLWVQIIGLVGTSGILPANSAMESVRQGADAQHLGLDRYHLVPTLCWFKTSDGFLRFQCAAGATLAALLVVGVAPAPCLFLLWLIYLSLVTVCREFLGFQWDNLLLETGFLAIFLAPLQLWPRRSRAAPPSRLVLWLLRWLLFKLMFQSGCVKLLSHDPVWRNLTALTFHYETQPLPTWIGWYAHQLPVWAQQASAAAMFGIELFAPFLIFAPRRLRHAACLVLVAFQTLILLTGNYCFFNLLTFALCLLLLDDAALKAFLPRRLRDSLRPPEPQKIGTQWNASLPDADHADLSSPLAPRRSPLNPRRWPVQVTVPLAAIAVVTSLMQFSIMFRVRLPWPRPLLAVFGWLGPFRSFNSYGLFAVMTTSRPEILIEGSDDGVTWRAYEFKYKPGDVKRRPGFVEPHQPRLDWQMWFAALGTYRQNPWLVNLCVRLLQGSPPVLALLERNPFPNAPPRYVRAVVYDYHFTDFATRRKTGAWWHRQETGEYLPALSLGDVKLGRERTLRRRGPT
ncbi:MAG: lipase maturation factor family protein [Limisphaerales bacterium]